MIYFSSDLHHSHTNIIKYCNRPYKDVIEMNLALVDNINSVVGKDDIFFILGDVAFCKGDRLKRFKDAINCKNIIVIKGNHDRTKNLIEAGFNHIYHEAYITIDGKRLWLNHYPLSVHDDRQNLKRPSARLKWDIALWGHTHVPKGKESLYVSGKLIGLNVGVDAHDYTPISWDTIMDKYVT